MFNKHLNSLLRIGFESAFAIVVINNLVVFVWRIIWSTQDAYFNENKYLNAWISLLGAYLILIYARCKQVKFLDKLYRPKEATKPAAVAGEKVLAEQDKPVLNSTVLTIDEKNETTDTTAFINDAKATQTTGNDTKKHICLIEKKMKLKKIVDSASQKTNISMNVKKSKSIFRKKILNWKETIKLKSFIMIFSFANINHWRGVWYLTSLYTNDSLVGLFAIGFLSMLSLLIMKRFCALMSVPFAMNGDGIPVAYQIQPISNKHNYYLTTDLKIKPAKWQIYLSVINEFLADIFTIQSWRSLWILLDQYLYVNDTIKSAQVSLVFGAVIYVAMFAVNRTVKKLMKHKCQSCLNGTSASLDGSSTSQASTDVNSVYLKISESESSTTSTSTDLLTKKHFWCWDKLKNTVFLYSLFLVAFFGTVNLWRGIWMLQTEYCYPSLFSTETDAQKQTNQNIINSVAMVVCLAVLIGFNSVSTLLPRSSCEDNVYYNGENPLLTDIRYRKYFLKKKTKKSASKTKTIWKQLGAKLLCMNYFSEPDCRKFVKNLVNSSTSNAKTATTIPPTAPTAPVLNLSVTAIETRQN